jgi:mycobactin lysine-N-oxygenase
MSTPSKRFVCIGAGPRSAAVVAQASAQKNGGVSNISVCPIEAFAVGANWMGRNGFTNGHFPLDTSPFKDVQFPGTPLGDKVNQELGSYSILEYMKSTGEYLRWVSGGTGPISHAKFAEYQRWVFSKAGVAIRQATVTRIDPIGPSVMVTYSNGNEIGSTIADGVMLSGPGDAKRLPIQDADPERISDGRTCWMSGQCYEQMRGGRVGVIGSGQSAGTIAKFLLMTNPSLEVHIVNRYGFLPAQSAGCPENTMCSAAGAEWLAIPLQDL